MKILVVNGHPRQDSLVGAFAEQYAAGAHDRGHDVQVMRLGELALEPYMSYRHDSDDPVITPQLSAMRDQVLWAEHLVFAYPIWWGLPPALLKVYFEVVFAPGVAFRYLPPRRGIARWDRLLAGRTAELIVTGDAPRWFWRYVRGAPDVRALERSVLGFCGVKLVTTSYFGPVTTSTPGQRDAWLDAARALGSSRPTRSRR
jgi:NAD(P)H dehydrogenase (quinone)